jgi:polyisoprenoid-binding protein YceI
MGSLRIIRPDSPFSEAFEMPDSTSRAARRGRASAKTNSKYFFLCMAVIALRLVALGSESHSRPARTGSSFPAFASAPASGESGQEAGNETHFKINREKSRITANVGVGGMLKGLGHSHVIAIRDFHGEVLANPSIVGSASVRLTIIANSTAEVGKEIEEKDRPKVNQAMHEEALETSRFPEVAFRSRSVTVKEAGDHQYDASISGDLTLHGVTRPVSFPAKIRAEGNSLRASGAFTILHETYGIKRLSAAGGTIKAKDEIELSFDIVADRD